MARDADQSGGLDALLDTMTNVVGVLIIVLVVLLLSVRDVVTRLKKLNPLPEPSQRQKLQAADLQSSQLELTIDRLQRQWLDLRLHDVGDDHQLKDLQEIMASLDDDFDVDAAQGIDPQQLASKVQRYRYELGRLTDEVDQLSRRLNHLQARTGAKQPSRIPKVTVARVPDPTPAPRDAKPLVFLCRYGRIFQFKTVPMVKVLHKGIAAARDSQSPWHSLSIQAFDRLAQYFEDHEIGQDGLRWKLQVVRRMSKDTRGVEQELRADLVWSRRDIGETLQDLQQRQSKFVQTLQAAKKDRVYGKFYVWGDSFSEYTMARQMIDSQGIPAGWVAQQGAAEYRVVLFSARSASDSQRRWTKAGRPVPARGRLSPGVGGYGPGAAGPGFAIPAGVSSMGLVGSSPGVDFVD